MTRIPTNGHRPLPGREASSVREKKTKKTMSLSNSVPPSFNRWDIFGFEITSPCPSVADGSDSVWKNKVWALMLDVASDNCRVPLGDELLNQLHLAQERKLSSGNFCRFFFIDIFIYYSMRRKNNLRLFGW